VAKGLIVVGVLFILFGVSLIVKYPQVWWFGLIIIALGIGIIGKRFNL